MGEDEYAIPEWTVELLRGIHQRLKLFPPSDVREWNVTDPLVNTCSGSYATHNRTGIGIGQDAVGGSAPYGVGSTGDGQVGQQVRVALVTELKSRRRSRARPDADRPRRQHEGWPRFGLAR